jgi:peptide/nickel transport system substrate-binding protein
VTRAKRTVAGTATLAVVAFLFAGCPKKKAGPAKSRRDSLVVHIETEPSHLLGMLQPDIWTRRIASHNIFQALVRIDPRSSKFEGELAKSWTRSADGKRYTFVLRQGVRWHDGKPFTGKDVKFTFDRMLDPRIRAASQRGALEPLIKSYELLPNNQFVIHCQNASRFLLQSLASLDILPAHIYAKGDLNRHPRARNPVGTGPYRFASWESGREIVVLRNETYWGKKAKIGRVVYRVVRDAIRAIQLAKKGEVDFLPYVRPGVFQRQVETDAGLKRRFKKVEHVVTGNFFILLNHQRMPFKDLVVRQSLARLVDRKKIIEKVLSGFARPVDSLIWFDDPDFDSTVSGWKFDPAGARKALAEAGFVDGDGDGVLERKGAAFSFEFLLPSASKSALRWLTLYQEELRKARIEMKIVSLDWAVFLKRIRAHDYDAATLGMKIDGPYTDLYLQFHSSQLKDGQNYSGFSSSEVDQLVQRVRFEANSKTRRLASSKLQRLLSQQVAVIPLFALTQPGLVARRIKGVYSSPSWYQIRDWWIK